MVDIVKQIIVVRKDLMTREENAMGPGKLAAQVAHASMAPLLELARGAPYASYVPPEEDYEIILDVSKKNPLAIWLEQDFRKVVLYVKSEAKLIQLFQEIQDAGFTVSLIQDKGLTVFNEPTFTCFGVEPAFHSEINPFVKKLQVL